MAPGPRWIGSALRAASLSALLASSAVLGAPQLVLVNGDVFTADPERPRAHALAIEDKRIRAVGDDADIRALAGPTTRVVNVGGRLVTPGLIEAHVHLGWHLPSPPIAMPGLPMPGPTPAQALAAVAAEAKKKPAWISAWIGPIVARDPRNWRDALDAAAPDTPVLLRASWGHTTIVNSAALNRLGIREDVADPLGGWWGRDAKGRLDGHAYESAENIEERAQPSDPQSLAAALRAAGERYARWGVTSIHLMNSRRSLSVTADALARAKTAQRWVVYHWAGAVEHIDDAWKAIDAGPRELPPRVRIEGPKWVLDGTPIERTAFQRSDYAGRPGWRGRSNYDDERLREILRQALHRPEQLALHVVGDAETDRLVAQMEALAPAQAWQAKRVRVEHGDGIRRDTLARVAKLGVVVIQNPLHFTAPPDPAAPPRQSLVKGLLEAGVPLALGSDGGGDAAAEADSEGNPFLNIMLACALPAAPGQALSREEALLAYTSGTAYAERAERHKGRLAPGMAADLTVLSQNVLTVPTRVLPATRSLLTVVDGEIAFEDPGLTDPGPTR